MIHVFVVALSNIKEANILNGSSLPETAAQDTHLTLAGFARDSYDLGKTNVTEYAIDFQ